MKQFYIKIILISLIFLGIYGGGLLISKTAQAKLPEVSTGVESPSLQYNSSVFVPNLPSKYIRLLSPTGLSVVYKSSKLRVSWEVKSFNLNEGKIRIVLFNGDTWQVVKDNLDLKTGTYDLDISNIEIKDPMRISVRVGAYDPQTGNWLTYGNYGQYYDDSGHFWVLGGVGISEKSNFPASIFQAFRNIFFRK